MTWCLLMLARHPDVQRNAREEVMSVLGTSQRLNYDDLDKLEYCDCVVKETLRYDHRAYLAWPCLEVNPHDKV